MRLTLESWHTITKTLRHLPKRMRACGKRIHCQKRKTQQWQKRQKVENRNLITCGHLSAAAVSFQPHSAKKAIQTID
uniref:HDC14880 n=1 Tax=Drosophila melanogaster TaxID=7227 RepID=Q6IJH8_DROME|nr:TPA_inf: HDC14880 [Drosophila melanogaster]